MPSRSQSDTERECSRYRSQLTTSKVTGAPSGKTSYVIIGDNAGPSKLAKIKDLRIKTLDEDGFLDLIRNRDEEPDEATLKKREKEAKKIKEAAAEMEKQEREEERLRKRKEAALAKSGVATKYVCPLTSLTVEKNGSHFFSALDYEVRAQERQGDLRKQGAGREAGRVACQLVCPSAIPS